MAALPSPTQVAGNHSAIYEGYYSLVDPKGFGTVGGMEAARFLKRSGLSDVVLSKIWDLSDPGGRGCLDKAGMFVALKLVALVQNGKELKVENVVMDVGPPKMGDIQLPKPVKPPPPVVVNKPPPLITSLPPTAVDWTVKPAEREKYDKLFESLQPTNGLIPGNKVKNVLMDSKLPVDTLGKIWDLADQDKDGMLDRHEFIVAMHLVYKALEKHAIPNVLPPELMPAKKTTPAPSGVPLSAHGLDGVTKPEIPPMPVLSAISLPSKPVQPVQPSVAWVVTAEEKAKSDALFTKSDIDRDGFVSGQEIKDVFLQSGVPQTVLAHIWGLCDIKQSGKLNNEQFALAMWLVARSLKGLEPPSTLTADMIPPSFRSTKTAEGLVENNNIKYSNPELEMISKDIDELVREKLALEADITQKEADIKIKSGEIKSLQSELDTLAATLKQLENQKGEAQKRLNDLKAQVDKLRAQAAEQAEAVAAQEAELNTKKQQLEGLRLEEQRLEQQKTESASKLENLTTNLQETQFSISQAKALITQLQEQTRQMNDAIQACDSAIESGDVTSLPDIALRINPEFRDAEYTKVGLVNGSSNKQNGFGTGQNDPFGGNPNGPLNNNNARFGDDLFNNDAFGKGDAFGSNDAFSAAFPKTNDGFEADPFGGSAFGSSTKTDPFDAFGDSRKNTDTTSEPNKDPFGCDPFAVLHAPTRDTGGGGVGAPPRPPSPSPALPPKKSKQPPPRPAPPRPTQPPSMKRNSTDFGSSDTFGSGGGGGSGGFADFSDFESKFSNKPNQSTTTAARTTTKNSKGLDFTDDPFRDYRYEDPFDIKFDDDDEDELKNNNSNSQNAKASQPSFGSTQKIDKFDPFGLDGRQSVPPLSNYNTNNNSSFADPFKNNNSTSGRSSVPLRLTSNLNNNKNLPSEDMQMAWAARESLRAEQALKSRELQEQADYEFALKLSRAEAKKS